MGLYGNLGELCFITVLQNQFIYNFPIGFTCNPVISIYFYCLKWIFFFFYQTCWGSDQCSTRLHLYHRSITGCSTRFCRIQSCPGKLPHEHLSRCIFKLTLLFATCFSGSYPWESSVNETLLSFQYSSYFSLPFYGKILCVCSEKFPFGQS